MKKARKRVAALAGLVLGLGLPVGSAGPAMAATPGFSDLTGATAYVQDFWEPNTWGDDPVWSDYYYSPLNWPEGFEIVHTLAWHVGTGDAVPYAVIARADNGEAFLEAARMVDPHGTACDSGAFEYSVDGVAWSSSFVSGAKYVLYQGNSTDFVGDDAPTESRGCNLAVLASANRHTGTSNGVAVTSLLTKIGPGIEPYSLAGYQVQGSRSESDYSPLRVKVSATPTSSLKVGDPVEITATLENRSGADLPQRSALLDVSTLLDDVDITSVAVSSGAADLNGDNVIWTGTLGASTVTFTVRATAKDGGDGKWRATLSGDSRAFSGMSGPRSNCQAVASTDSLVWVNGQLLTTQEVAAMSAAEYAEAFGPCSVGGTIGLADTETEVAITGPAGTITTPNTKLTGTGEAGATVAVSLDGVVVDTVTVGGDGTWELPVSNLAEGEHEVSVLATDKAGNTATDTLSFTVDTQTVVAITGPTGKITTTNTAITGTGEPGAKVEVFLDGAGAGTVTVGTDGTWELPVSNLAEGEHEVSVLATDSAGNTATDTLTFTVTLGDTPGPPAPGSDDRLAMTGANGLVPAASVAFLLVGAGIVLMRRRPIR